MRKRPRSQKGFSLIEIIVIIVVAGFLGVLLVNLMGTQLIKSATPITSAKDAATAEAIMENVVTYYTGQVNTNVSGVLDNIKTHYQGNSSISFTDNATWFGESLRALVVTVTVGQTAVENVFFQARTSASDTNSVY